MKQSLIILLISVCAANAQMWTNVETGAVAPQPERRPADAVNVSEEWFILPGWQPFSLAQQAAWDAAESAKAEADDAAAEQYADPQPAVFAPRFRGSITNVVGLSQILVDDETGLPVALDETGSPEHTTKQKDDQNAAAKADRAAAKAAVESAAKNGKVNDRLAANEAALKTLLK